MPVHGLHETRRAFRFKYELINIQTQIHWNKICVQYSFCCCAFCPCFLWIYLVIIRIQCPHFYSNCTALGSNVFMKKYSFLSCCKFILRECASYDGRFDSNENKRVKKFKIEWVHTHELQTKDLKSHCIGHKNCWLTLYFFLFYFVFLLFLCFCFWLERFFFCAFCTLLSHAKCELNDGDALKISSRVGAMSCHSFD